MPELHPKDVKTLAVCRDCDARIMWMSMEPGMGTGKKHPVNAEPDDENGNIVLYQNWKGEQFFMKHYNLVLAKIRALGLPDSLFTSHFQTCTKRKPWERRM